MSFKGAIFDLDGVVVNTIPLHYRAWKKMFSEYGKNFTMRDYEEKVDGILRDAGAKAILTGIDDAEIERAAARKQAYFLRFLEKKEVDVYESSVRLIEELRAKGIRTAIISSSRNCHDILEKAGLVELFEVEVNGNDTVAGKPHPWVFLEAAQRLGLEPEECIVFEDALLGVEAGKRAGMFTVGVDRREAPGRLGKADKVISGLREINYETLRDLLS